ncbi:MAG TPA: DUF1223 domain-containing protein [Burkholderiaceae bacterium]|nr:DUF1223 domain-containing protein [Burkholderiaceae bacterium]
MLGFEVVMVQFGWAPAGGAALALTVAAATVHGQPCRAESGAQVPVVVELYTSEGCSSCPPADRWLSTLKDKPGVLAAAFHVDYWDGLGWKDRFASPRYSERQAQLQAASGARFSYTPQVRVNGADWRRWPQLPQPLPVSPAQVSLQRDGDQVDLKVQPLGAVASRWALWWAAVEDGHDSDVKAGENGGVRLHHDHVVRVYGGLAPWRGELAQRIAVPARGEDGRPLRLIAVVTDADSGATVQALQLRCAP